jgi:hypothetical protein
MYIDGMTEGGDLLVMGVGEPFETVLDPGTSEYAYLARVASDGGLLWAQATSGARYPRVMAPPALASAGGVWMAGVFEGTGLTMGRCGSEVTLDGTDVRNTGTYFLARFDP